MPVTTSLRYVAYLCLGSFLLFFPTRILAEHHDTWIAIQTPHFTVLSNAGEFEGRKTALQFEQVRGLFLELYPNLRADSGKPTTIFAIKNEDSFKLFMPSYGQNSKAMHLAGFYQPSSDKNFAVIRTDVRGEGALGYHVLYHEYTHAFFRYNYRSLPVWLDEGFAEFYGNTTISGKEGIVGEPNASQIGYLKHQVLLPLDKLLTIDRTSPLYNTNDHSGIFYAESWALVHYLELSAEMRGKNLLNKYQHALHETDDPIVAAEKTFGDLKKFTDGLYSYINSAAFYTRHVPLQSNMSEKDFTARTLPPAEGLLAQADYLLHSHHLPEALALYHEVESIDKNAPGYHFQLGYYHFLNGDYTNAEPEIQKALLASPNDFSVHLLLANLYYRRDGYTETTVPKIRAELEKVVSLNPDGVGALAFLSRAYLRDPGKDVNKALKDAMRASELEPGSLTFYLDIGRALLAAERIPEAKKVAESAQKTASTPGDRAMATNFAKQIQDKVDHPNDTAAAKATADPPADGGASASDTDAVPTHAEGKITEVMCGRAPEVLLTLTTADKAMLLHVTDISKITVRLKDQPSDVAALPCSAWNGQQATIDYRAMRTGLAQGEIQSLSLP